MASQPERGIYNIDNRLALRRGLRRGLVNASLNGAAATLAIAAGIGLIVNNECRQDDLTSEQKKAMQLFLSADEAHFVHDIHVVGETVGQDRQAFARNKPETQQDKDDLNFGKKVADLPIDESIDRALVVWGNDRDRPWDKNAKDKWLAIKTDDEVVFASEHLFEATGELAAVEPIDLSGDSSLK